MCGRSLISKVLDDLRDLTLWCYGFQVCALQGIGGRGSGVELRCCRHHAKLREVEGLQSPYTSDPHILLQRRRKGAL